MEEDWMDEIINQHRQRRAAERLQQQTREDERNRFEAGIEAFWLSLRDALTNAAAAFNTKNDSEFLWAEAAEKMVTIKDGTGKSAAVALERTLQYVEVVYIPELTLASGESVNRKMFSIGETNERLVFKEGNRTGPDIPINMVVKHILADFVRSVLQ
jgi:hypothetical protein